MDSPSGKSGKSGKAGDAPKGKPPSGELSTDAALDAIEARALKKAIDREGEPETALSPFEPADVELAEGVLKFHCRCGKRISVPPDPRKAVGKCPKCGARLLLPKGPTPKEPPKEPPKGSKREAAEAPSAEAKVDGEKKPAASKAKRDADAAAKQIRKSRTQKIEPLAGRPEAPPASAPRRPSWAVRFFAFQVDAALVAGALFAVHYGLVRAGVRELPPWYAAVVIAVAVWFSNRVMGVYVSSRTLGMAVTGLKFRRPDGRRITFGAALVRALAGVGLMPLAPVGLFTGEGDTPADDVAGFTVVRSGK